MNRKNVTKCMNDKLNFAISWPNLWLSLSIVLFNFGLRAYRSIEVLASKVVIKTCLSPWPSKHFNVIIQLITSWVLRPFPLLLVVILALILAIFVIFQVIPSLHADITVASWHCMLSTQRRPVNFFYRNALLHIFRPLLRLIIERFLA